MKKVYFLPRYIGALKYYEKLFPALRGAGVSPAFLLFEDQGMIEYCTSRKLLCDRRFAVRKVGRIPFFSALAHERHILQNLDTFLDETKPHMLISEPIMSHRARALFLRAQKRGIVTHALQWSQVAHLAMFTQRAPLRKRLLALKGGGHSLFGGLLYSVYLALLRMMFACADAFSGGGYYIVRGNHTDSIGVIDDSARAFYIKHGWQADTVHVVGYADFTLAYELARQVREKPATRTQLMQQYGLPEGRRTIFVLSTPFYTGFHAVFLDEAGQRAYYKNIFDEIRSVFGSTEATIIFKLHPRERNIYSGLASESLRIFHNEANTEELIALSDLYIAHPISTANFTLRASKVPAIFINFTPLEYMDAGRELYSLRYVARSHEEFHQLLREFKDGKLPMQYSTDGVDTDSLRKIVSFIAGGTTGD